MIEHIQPVISAVHCAAGVITLAEALNKLERTDPLRPGMNRRAKVTEWLKALAWSLLAVGAAGAVVTPLLPLEKPTLQDAAVLVGFATLIIRTRVKEG